VQETQSAFGLFTQQAKTNRPFQFQERSHLFVGVHNEALTVVAMRVNNPDRLPIGFHG
jgi:hypothetical protein